MSYKIHLGNCLDIMQTYPDNYFSSCVSDPPYGLEFMGKDWDHGVPGEIYWKELLRVCKPGSHALIFGGSRTHHRLMVSLEDAGWEIRDVCMWIYSCLSEDTEILVDGRWEPYHKALVGNHALCYNINNDTFEWQEIQELVVYEYDDTAYRIQSNNTDQLVSRNHRCIVERDGNKVFKYAEALQQQESVPILEDLPGLLTAVSMSNKRTSNKKQNLFKGMLEKVTKQAKNWTNKTNTRAYWKNFNNVLCLSEKSLQTQSMFKESPKFNMFKKMQWDITQQRTCKIFSQGKMQLDTSIQRFFQKENVWCEQSSLEGWSNIFSQERKLQSNKVYTLPTRIYRNGTQGWICDGTPLVGSSTNRKMFIKNGNSSSYQSRSTGQQTGEFNVVQEQQRTQKIRTQGFTTSDLAIVTPVHYKGKVWCVRVPTGAFVARRNGKIFVTGNSGFPKNLNVDKELDKIEPSIQHNTGFGSGLKPAWEPIILARKPISEKNIAQNVLKWGTGAINLKDTRIEGDTWYRGAGGTTRPYSSETTWNTSKTERIERTAEGRWPANVLLDEEIAEQEEWAKYFYCSKVQKKERNHGLDDFAELNVYSALNTHNGHSDRFDGNPTPKAKNNHPTVKPVELMKYLSTMITPNGGNILDPFMGSGSTLVAAISLGYDCVGIDIDEHYCNIARARCNQAVKDLQ